MGTTHKTTAVRLKVSLREASAAIPDAIEEVGRASIIVFANAVFQKAEGAGAKRAVHAALLAAGVDIEPKNLSQYAKRAATKRAAILKAARGAIL